MIQKDNIALIGGRATGKSVVAKLLAEKLDYWLMQTDELVVKKTGLNIPEIVEQKGWQHFRQLEYEVLQEVPYDHKSVIDCGGGIVCEQTPDNKQHFSGRKVKLLKQNCLVIWLECPVEEQLKRMGDDPNRPSLTGELTAQAELEEIMNTRHPWYKQAADLIIDSSELTAEQIVAKIIIKLESEI